MKLTLTIISDTHNRHKRVSLPKADILIHAGDFSSKGFESEVKDFMKWFKRQPYPYKILIAGNHDLSFDASRFENGKRPEWLTEILDDYLSDPCNYYLENTNCEIEGIKFWGSPITPIFGRDWAFNAVKGAPIREYWDLIPRDTHVVITHGPAHMKLDRADPNFYHITHDYVGCDQLRWVIQDIKPLLHICGHVHESYGHDYDENTEYINASICNLRYEPINKPFNLEIDIIKKTINHII